MRQLFGIELGNEARTGLGSIQQQERRAGHERELIAQQVGWCLDAAHVVCACMQQCVLVYAAEDNYVLYSLVCAVV